MQITDVDIAEFQQAYSEAFGDSIGSDDAREMASRVLFLFEVLSKPLPTDTHAHLDAHQSSAVGSDQRSN